MGLGHYGVGGYLFQSLGRDSGCSSSAEMAGAFRAAVVSIPRSGFWVFKPAGRGRRRVGRDVSIPRSGFWVFKPTRPLTKHGVRPSFNPSVGILGVQAIECLSKSCRSYPFQSLGRDSGCSSLQPPADGLASTLVSIPRSGFWVFKLEVEGEEALGFIVSIPRSGFWVFKLTWLKKKEGHICCFNPSVGILGVQASADEVLISGPAGFQSLGRDSGCSSSWMALCPAHDDRVSIPRSGFWVFKRANIAGTSTATPVSIPRSGFWVFKPP